MTNPHVEYWHDAATSASVFQFTIPDVVRASIPLTQHERAVFVRNDKKPSDYAKELAILLAKWEANNHD